MFLRTCNKKLKVFSFLYHVNISILFCSFFIKSHSALPIPRRADKDPKTCEILVDNVQSKDLGAWRSSEKILRLLAWLGVQNYPGVLSGANAQGSEEQGDANAQGSGEQ